MKKLFVYPFLLVLLGAAACVKTTQTPTPLPSGTFTGPFTVIHLSPKTGKLDTATATITLSMSATTGYKVTGDTSKIQAGSYGSYIADGTYIQFIDHTTTGTATAKVHLNGIYQYQYNGASLNIYASTDTLGFTYTLKSN